MVMRLLTYMYLITIRNITGVDFHIKQKYLLHIYFRNRKKTDFMGFSFHILNAHNVRTPFRCFVKKMKKKLCT